MGSSEQFKPRPVRSRLIGYLFGGLVFVVAYSVWGIIRAADLPIVEALVAGTVYTAVYILIGEGIYRRRLRASAAS